MRTLLLGAAIALSFRHPLADAYSPINTRSCRAGGPQNVIFTLPRVDRTGKAVSSDLGTYTLLNCSSSGCAAALPPASAFTGGSSDPSSISRYVEGIILYPVFALLCAILVIASSCAFILHRHIFACCCPACRCGSPHPTKRTGRAWWRCGAMPPPGVDDDDPNPVVYAYPHWERLLVTALLVVFLILMICFIIIGNVSGMQALPLAARNAAGALTTAWAPLITAGVGAGTALTTSLLSNAVAPTLLAMNSTLQSGISLPVVDASLACVLSSIDTLPDLGELLSSATSANATLIAINASVPLLIGQVGVIIATVGNVSTSLNTLNGTVSSLSPQLQALNGTLGNISTTLTSMDAQRLGLNASALIVQRDLSYLQPSALPPPSVIASTCGPATVTNVGVAGSLNRLIQRVMNGNASDTTLLANNVASINTTLAAGMARTNYSRTADLISGMLASMAVVQSSTLPALSSAIGTAQGILNALPRSGVLLPPVNALWAAAQSVNVGGITTQLVLLDGYVKALPNITQILSMIDSIAAVSQVVPCVLRASAEVSRLNATLLQLPASLSSALSQVSSVNDTVNTALASLTTVRAQLRSAQAQIDAVNVSSYLAQATSLAASINSTVNAFNFTAVIARINSIDANIVTVNFTALNASLASLNASLSQTILNASSLQQLRTFESTRTWLVQNMSQAAADYAILSGGYCSNAVSTRCTVNANCPGGTCAGIAAFRCRNTPATVCNTDADCVVPGDACLADPTRATLLKGLIQGLALFPAGSVPDTSAAVSQISTLQGSMGSVDVAGMQASLTAAQAAGSAVDTSGIQSSLVSINASLSNLDTATIMSTLSGVQSTVSSISFSQFTPQIASVNSTVTDLRTNQRSMIVNARSAVSLASTMLNDRLGTYASQLSAPALSAVLASEGSVGMIASVAALGQNALNTVAAGQTFISIPSMDLMNALPNKTIGIATSSGQYNGYLGAGLVNWALSTMGVSSLIAPTDPSAAQIWRNGAGDAYPNNAMCITDACVAATVDSFRARTVAELTSGGVPLSLTPLGALTLVWIFPIFVVVLGMLALVSPLMCRDPRWQKVPASCMTGCICLQLPTCFILAGMLWPAIMLMGDMCASGPNVGYAIVTAQSSSVCKLLGGTASGATGCAISASISLPDGSQAAINATLDVSAIYAAMLGDSCPPVDPWSSVITQVSNQMRTLPYTQAAYFLGSSSVSSTLGVTPLPALLTPVYNATNITGALLANWLTNTASSVLSCPMLSAPIKGTLDIVCCNFFGPLYWMASSWFLLAFFMCCCGLPAGILGRKRMVTRVWGPLYTEPKRGDMLGVSNSVSSGSGQSTARRNTDMAIVTNPLQAASSPTAAGVAGDNSREAKHGVEHDVFGIPRDKSKLSAPPMQVEMTSPMHGKARASGVPEGSLPPSPSAPTAGPAQAMSAYQPFWAGPMLPPSGATAHQRRPTGTSAIV